MEYEKLKKEVDSILEDFGSEPFIDIFNRLSHIDEVYNKFQEFRLYYWKEDIEGGEPHKDTVKWYLDKLKNEFDKWVWYFRYGSKSLECWIEGNEWKIDKTNLERDKDKENIELIKLDLNILYLIRDFDKGDKGIKIDTIGIEARDWLNDNMYKCKECVRIKKEHPNYSNNELWYYKDLQKPTKWEKLELCNYHSYTLKEIK